MPRQNYGTAQYLWKPAGMEVPVHCTIEWQRGSPATWDDPGEPDECYVTRAEVNGIDISPCLSDETLESICDNWRDCVTAGAADARIDREIDRREAQQAQACGLHPVFSAALRPFVGSAA